MFCFVLFLRQRRADGGDKSRSAKKTQHLFSLFYKVTKKECRKEIDFPAGKYQPLNREPDARAYFTDVPQLFKHSATFATSHHVSIPLDGFNVPVFVRR